MITGSKPRKLNGRDWASAARHFILPLVAGVVLAALTAAWAVVEAVFMQSGPGGLSTLSWADLIGPAKLGAAAFVIRLGQRGMADMQAKVAKMQEQDAAQKPS